MLEKANEKQYQDLTELQQKKNRADKSLALMQTNWNKKKIEISDNNPHLAQLQFEIETDKNKTLISSLKYFIIYSEIQEKTCQILAL